MSLYANPRHMMDDAQARTALATFDRLAILVTPDLSITHLPVAIEGDRIQGHVAKANGVWRSAPCDAVMIFPGAEAYVSPNWYPSKAAHHRAVPTWNYTTVHVRGRLEAFHDADRIERLVASLSDAHEARESHPWRLTDAPRDYIERLVGALVGVSLTIAQIEGKAKLSQDRSAEDQARVREALLASADPRDQAVGALMAPPTD